MFTRGVKKFVNLLSVIALVAAGSIATAAPASAATRSFASRFSTNAQGDITFVANTLMTCTPSVACSAALTGTAVGANNNNNNHVMLYVDRDADPSTFNSSSASLALPSGANVLFARLYWGGTSASAARTSAKFKVPGATAYTTLTASQLDNNGNDYQGSVDVTAAVQAAGVGSYTVADVQSTQAGGAYAGWSLVVAYSDPNGVMRNLTVFDGYQVVSSAAVDISVNGFLTPPVGPVNTKLGVVAYEGDLGTLNDQLTLNGVVIGDALNPTNNFFNSSISNSAGSVVSRDPSTINTLGFDADIVQVANPSNTVLANSATSANIRLSTGGDVYYPGVVTFVTDLYAPKMKVDKSYADVNGGSPRPGDELEYTLTVSNTGKDPAINVVLTDAIPANTTYIPGSLSIVSGAGTGPKSDATGNDQGEFAGNQVKFFLGTGATGLVGGRINENDVTSVKFRVRISPTAPDNVAIPNTANLTFTALTLGSTSITPSVVVPVVTTNKADLAITKSDGAASEIPGTPIQYTIVVTNTAGSTNLIADAIVSDALPASLTGATWTCSASPGSNCDAATGSGSINTTVDLAVNGTATFLVNAVVSPNATGSLSNTATVTAPVGVTDLVPGNNSATDTDTLAPRGDVAITKTNGTTSTVPGEVVTYTIVASNSGPSVATAVTINDAPPATSGTVSWSCVATSGSSCVASGTGDLATAANLASGGTATYTVTYTVSPSAVGQLVNDASLGIPSGFTDTFSGNNAASDTDTLLPKADLSVTKTHTPAIIVPGTTTTYTVTVKNSGPSVVATADLEDVLPAGFTVSNVASSVWTCSAPITSINCTATNLIVGTSTITVIGTFDQSATGLVENVAKVSTTSASDPNPANNTAMDSSVLAPSADLVLTKSHRPTDAVAGSIVTYVLDVVNLGPSTALDVNIEDALPAGLTYIDASGSGWACANPAGQDVSCSLASLPVGSTTVTMTVRLDAGATGTLKNSAAVNSQTPDPNAGNNTSTDTTPIVLQADLEISKVHVGVFVAGNTVQWTIVATNRGPSNVIGASISDTPPVIVTGVSWTCSGVGGGECPAGPASGAPSNVLIDLPSGASVTMLLNGTLDPSNGTATVTNTATLTPPVGVTDPNSANNTVTDSTAAAARADLLITKTNNQTSIVPGTVTTYTIVASNAGPSSANGAVITDAFPAALTGTSWTCTPAGGAVCGATSGSASLNETVNLRAGSSLSYSVTGTVDSSATGNLSNTASVRPPSSVVETDLSNNSASDKDPLTPVIDLAIVKRGPVTAIAGTTISYTLTVTNAGPSRATPVTVTDAIPAGIVAQSWTCVEVGDASCDSPSGLDVTGMIGKITPGGTLTFTITAAVGAGSVGSLTNTATVAGDPAVIEANLDDNESSIITEIVREVDLSVTKDDSVTKVVAGGSTTYILHIKNAGPSLVGDVKLIDILPLEAISATWRCFNEISAGCYNGSGTDSIDEFFKIEPGGSFDVEITVLIRTDARGQITNSVMLELPAGVTDTRPSNNQAEDIDDIVANAELTVTKTSNADPGPVSSGQIITYTVRIANAGPSTVANATFTDPSPASLTGVTWTCAPIVGASPATHCPASGSGPIDTVISLGAGEQVEFSIVGTVSPTARGNIVNTATAKLPADVTSPSGAPSKQAVNTLTIVPRADLSITKTDAVTEAVPGESVSYTIVVTNAGPAAVTNATVTDNPTSAFPNGSWSCVASAGGSCVAGGGNGVINTTVSLPALGTATFVFSGLVNPFAAASGATTMSNTATVAAPADVTELDAINNIATDIDDLKPKANVSVTKTDNVVDAIPGSSVSYLITVTNAGPSALVDALFTDNLPASLSGVNWTCAVSGASNDCSVGSGTTSSISLLLDLAPMATALISVSARIDPSARGSLSNTATVEMPTGTTDPDGTNNSATDTDNLTPRVDLRTTKTHAGNLIPGTQATWTIVVSNGGPSSALAASVIDTLPSSLSAATWTCAATSGSVCGAATGSGNINTLVDLAPSGSVTYTLTAIIDPGTTGDLTNVATAAPPAGTVDIQPANDSATDTAVVQPVADLTIAKVKSGPIVPGQPISYTVTVTNNGPSTAVGARVLDVIPSVLTSPTWSCTANGSGALCGTGNGSGDIDVLVTLPPSTNTVFTIIAGVPQTATGTIVNTAQVLTPAGVSDPDPLSNQASDTGVAQPRADLRITKSDFETSSTPGDAISYAIVVTNDGPSAVPGAVVTDNLPSTLTDATWTCSATVGSSCGTSSGTGNFSAQVSLVSGAQATFIVNATIDPTARGSLTNTANVVAPATVIDAPGNNDAADTNTLTPKADLRVRKRSVGVFVPGAPVQWVVEVTNLGPSTVTGATVTDPLPGEVSSSSWNCSVFSGPVNACGTASGMGDIGTTVSLGVGSTATFSVDATLVATARGTLSNTASAVVPVGVVDPVSANNSSTDIATLLPKADLRVVKSHLGALVPGGTATYEVVVTNDGPSTVVGARVTDTLASVLGGASWTCSALNGSCTGSGTGNPDVLVDLGVNGVATITVQATIDPAARGSLSNTAIVALPVGTSDPDPSNNRSTDSAPLTPRANLSLVKNHTGSIVPGQTVTYSVTIGNAGPSNVVGASVIDTLPGVLMNASWSCVAQPSASCPSVGTGSINTTVDIAVGSSVEFTLVATVDPTTTSPVANSASVAPPADTADPDLSDNSRTDSAPVVQTVDLVVTKRHSGDFIPGRPVTWSITVANRGPSAVTGATVVDVVPVGVNNASWICNVPGATGNACGSGSGVGGINTTVDLLPGATASFEFSGDIFSGSVGTLTNSVTALVPSGVTEPSSGNNTAVDSGPRTPIADLVITKAHSPNPIVPGQPVTYTVNVWNNGPSDAPNSLVTDDLSAELQSAGWVCVGNLGGSCDDASGSGDINTTVDLVANSGAVFTITATANPSFPGSFANTARIAAPAGVVDPDLTSNTASDPGTGQPTVDLRVSKSHTGIIVPGEPATYSIVVSNSGPSTATNASVTDILPAGLGAASWSCGGTGGNTCTDGTGFGNINTTVTLLPAGSVTFTLTANVDPTFRGDMTNTASVSAPLGTIEINPTNNDGSDQGELVPKADLQVRKRSAGAFVPGTNATYEITVFNAGDSVVSAAQVLDTIPAGISGVTWSCTVNPATTVSFAATFTNSCLVGNGLGNLSESVDLGVGATATFTVVGLIDPSFRAVATGREVINSATAVNPVGVADPLPLNNTGLDTTPLTPRVALTTTKRHVGALIPGTEAVYEIVVSNAGPSTALSAVVVDSLPSTLSGAEWTCVSAGGTCGDVSGSGNIATTVTLLPGGIATYSLRARIDSSARGVMANSASTVPVNDETDTTVGDDSPIDSGPLNPVVNLSISKSHADAIVPGARATWMIVVTNNGPSDVVNATVSDTLAATLSAASWTCSVPGGTTNRCGAAAGSGSFATTVWLATGKSATFELSALVDASVVGNVVNTASVATPADTVDPDPDSNSATDNGVSVPTADLAVTKTHTGIITPGSPVTYTITVSNNGPSVAANAVVRDVLPSALTNPRWSCSSTTGSSCATTSFVGALDTTVTLAPSGVSTFVLTVDVDSNATANVLNRAFIAVPAGVYDPQSANDSALDSSVPKPVADLVITKTHTGDLTPSLPAVYTITVTNNGPSSVASASIVDTLPATLTTPTWTCVATTGSRCPANGIGAPNLLVDLISGGSVTITLTVSVSLTAVGDIVNTAEVVLPSGVIDPNLSSNRVLDRAAIVSFVVIVPPVTTVPPPATDTSSTVVSNEGSATGNANDPSNPAKPTTIPPVLPTSALPAPGSPSTTTPTSDIAPATVDRPLALTGTYVLSFLVIGLLLLTGGTGLTATARRRRPTD